MAHSRSNIRLGILIFLAFTSGCCSLAYEILYMRALTVVLGDMFYVHAALLSTFLVGIGIGAKLAHHYFRWLFAFEIFTGLYACALPPLLRYLLEQPLLGIVTSVPFLTILMVVLLLTIPCFLIGFSLPLFSGYLKASAPNSLAFQPIYTIYNFGALLSIIGCEFFLIRHWGISASLTLIGILNLLIGILLVLTRQTPISYPQVESRRFPKRILIALALASACSSIFQMFVLKLFYLVFEPHRENFAIGLSVTFLGIFLGAILASKTKIRFETCMLLVPVSIGLIYFLYVPIVQLYQKTAPWVVHSELLNILHKFFIGCLFELVPMALFGALLPALLRAENQVSEESGQLLCVSSLANALGYLLYVLLGHPFLNTPILFGLLGVASLVSSLLASEIRFAPRQKILGGVGALLSILCIIQWDERKFYLAQWMENLRPHYEVFNFKSGAENATLVRARTFEWISYNGNASVEIHKNGVINFAEMANGVVPALNAPRFEKALVLGLGTGITAGTAARIFQQTEVVEINPSFYKMMPLLEYASFDICHNPGTTIHVLDARAFLIGKVGIYDAVINAITTPEYFSASKIYTYDFFTRVAKSLKPDGIFSLHIITPLLSPLGTQTLLSALRKNFKYGTLRVFRNGYYMLTCSNQPMKVRKFQDLPIPPQLMEQLKKSLNDFTLEEYFEDIQLSSNIFEQYEPQVAQENTDDFPIIEFLAVRRAQRKVNALDLFLIKQEVMSIDPVRKSEISDPLRMVHRMGVFYHFSPRYFHKNFEPLLKEDPTLQKLFEQWKKEHPSPQ